VPELVTLHLWRVPRRRVGTAVARVAVDRLAMRRVPGALFSRVLGTGAGRTFRLRDAQPDRWALLTCWAGAADAAAFEQSRVAARWADLATERWRINLRPLAAHGSWAGHRPFDTAPPADAPAPDEPRSGNTAGDAPRAGNTAGDAPRGGDMAGTATALDAAADGAFGGRGTGSDGPVAAVTWARIRWRGAVGFWRAVPAVAAELGGAPGLLFALGIGERPVGVQGTFSVWESERALRGFAYGGPAHAGAVRGARAHRWFGEALFARFAVLAGEGTVDGRDPLRAAARSEHAAAAG
jgi:hypothetical protein